MSSRALIDHIYDIDKIIQEDWEWEERPECLVGSAEVLCIGEDYDLTLNGWCNPQRPDLYEFSLMFERSTVVRRWDNNSRHTLPDGERCDGPHKHRWTEDHEDKLVYEVDDVATDDVDQAFEDFLDECNIERDGGYHRPQVLNSNEWM
ncbi:DUF6978 family protein [Halorussus halophilus]|uniref:DUF6978 family protein n=1 Tax=Halorussus halophilus TaxID=2650975 RepID=UPI00130192F6|nr:hypothetical protein [Halorussus halophilus]